MSVETKEELRLTDKGRKILIVMQQGVANEQEVFTATDIAKDLFSCPRSVSGSMRKLVKDGIVEKDTSDSPVKYSLSSLGMNIKIVD